MGPSSSDIAERKLVAAHDALMKTRGLQFDFKAVPQPPPPPDWFTELLRFLGGLGPVFRFIFWAGLVLAGVLVAWFMVREIMAMRRGPQSQRVKPTIDWRPEPTAARALLEEADRLAAAGRHGEAIHLLLYRSIDDLGVRRPGSVRPALTSRDIANLPTMPERPREAFARIAEAVERNVFGGRPVEAGDFARCRSDYEAFAFPEAWS